MGVVITRIMEPVASPAHLGQRIKAPAAGYFMSISRCCSVRCGVIVERIAARRRCIVGVGVIIRTPFPYVSVHVVHVKHVRQASTHRVCPVVGIRAVPGITGQITHIGTTPRGLASGPAEVLPLGFRWEPAAYPQGKDRGVEPGNVGNRVGALIAGHVVSTRIEGCIHAISHRIRRGREWRQFNVVARPLAAEMLHFFSRRAHCVANGRDGSHAGSDTGLISFCRAGQETTSHEFVKDLGSGALPQRVHAGENGLCIITARPAQPIESKDTAGIIDDVVTASAHGSHPGRSCRFAWPVPPQLLALLARKPRFWIRCTREAAAFFGCEARLSCATGCQSG